MLWTSWGNFRHTLRSCGHCSRPPARLFPAYGKGRERIRDCEKHAHAVEYSLMKRKALSATTLMRGSRPRAFACIEHLKAVRGEARKTKEENNNRIGHNLNSPR